MASRPLFDGNDGLQVGEKLTGQMPMGFADQRPDPLGPSTEHIELVQWIGNEIEAALSQHVDKFRSASREAYRFVSGDQYDPETRKILRIAKRPDTAFDFVHKYVSYVTGLERRSPQALMYEPTVVDDVQQQFAGEFLTQCYEWAMNRCSGHAERSRAFRDMLITGMGWTHCFLNKHRDPRGLIDYKRVSPLEMIWPDCPDENLNTTPWRAREVAVDRRDAIRRFPDHRAAIEAAAVAGDSRAFPNGGPITEYTVPYIETVPIDKAGGTRAPMRGKVKILEFQYFSDEDGKSFVDPVTKEFVWLDDESFRKYERSLQVMAPNVRVLAEKAPHRVYRVAYLLNRKVLLAEPARLPGDRFTLNCMTGHFDEDSRLWYGFVRLLMDPQRYANKFFNQLLEIMGVSAKGGAIAEESAFTDNAQKQEFLDTFSQAGSVNTVAHGAIAEGRIKEKQVPEIPAATMAMLEWCVRSMEQVTGVSTSSLGLEGDGGGGQMPALTMRQRQSTSMVLLAQEFDTLSRFRSEDEGRVIAAFLGLIADGRLVRVGGAMGAKATMPLLRDPFALEYDVIMDDVEADPMQRERFAQTLMSLGPLLAKQGMFTPEMLNYLNLPVKVRQSIIQSIQSEQKRQEEAAAAGINLRGRGGTKDPRETQAKIGKILAQTELDRARTMAVVADAKRDDFRAMVEHTDSRERNMLEANRQELERMKAHAQTTVDLIQAMQDKRGGREE